MPIAPHMRIEKLLNETVIYFLSANQTFANFPWAVSRYLK